MTNNIPTSILQRLGLTKLSIDEDDMTEDTTPSAFNPAEEANRAYVRTHLLPTVPESTYARAFAERPGLLERVAELEAALALSEQFRNASPSRRMEAKCTEMQAGLLARIEALRKALEPFAKSAAAHNVALTDTIYEDDDINIFYGEFNAQYSPKDLRLVLSVLADDDAAKGGEREPK